MIAIILYYINNIMTEKFKILIVLVFYKIIIYLKSG